MRAGPVVRGGRSVARTGAVLLLLLAALTHVLDCAHGPNPGLTERADTLLLTPSAGGAQTPGPSLRTAVGRTAPEQDGTTHCCGADEPTLQPPRVVPLTVPAAVHGAPATCPFDARPAVGPASRRSRPVPDDLSPTGARARLGVWRT
ncbi:hypothetical protein [Streptomyces sp. NPDC101237]|uniref:hypothetical protein n=1 Tax=Streptomyces sp. NPDC101237 TaxID=3366139 RepID=UPI0037F1B61C